MILPVSNRRKNQLPKKNSLPICPFRDAMASAATLCNHLKCALAANECPSLFS
jgi:hypothetical protein